MKNTFRLTPKGSDTSAAGPWATLAGARDAQRKLRARLPKFSANAHDGEKSFRLGAMRFPKTRGLFACDHVFKPTDGDIQPWPCLHDAEIVLLQYWVETRLPNPRLDPATGWVSCARRSVFNLYESFNPKLARDYIDKLFEALTEPGAWYLDRVTGRPTYLRDVLSRLPSMTNQDDLDSLMPSRWQPRS